MTTSCEHPFFTPVWPMSFLSRNHRATFGLWFGFVRHNPSKAYALVHHACPQSWNQNCKHWLGEKNVPPKTKYSFFTSPASRPKKTGGKSSYKFTLSNWPASDESESTSCTWVALGIGGGGGGDWNFAGGAAFGGGHGSHFGGGSLGGVGTRRATCGGSAFAALACSCEETTLAKGKSILLKKEASATSVFFKVGAAAPSETTWPKIIQRSNDKIAKQRKPQSALLSFFFL